MSKNDIVLHTCCAPCAGWCVQKLLEEDKRVILYYSNDNLCSLQEFAKQRLALRHSMYGFIS